MPPADPLANPFPGMNPYLEGRWGDVHTRLVAYAGDAIQDGLPANLRARMQERVFVETEAAIERIVSPDVHVYEFPRGRRETAGGGGTAVAEPAAAADEPVLVHLNPVEVREPYLQLIDTRSGGRVVTVVEFVSRSNKLPGPGRVLYLQKQQEVVEGGVNLVEVDLLRAGQPVTRAAPHLRTDGPVILYHVSVWRAARPGDVADYARGLADPLPMVKIPLRRTDVDVPLNLQALIDTAYRRGRYDDIDYAAPPDPPLGPDDAAWADVLLREKGLRPA